MAVVDWTELNSDVVRVIAKKLGDVSNFLRFRVVCKAWRSSTSYADVPRQFPWLLQHNRTCNLKFYSVSSDKSYTIPFPKAHSDKHLSGPSDGYVLTCAPPDTNGFRFAFLNPLTWDEIVFHSKKANPYCVVRFGRNLIKDNDHAVTCSVWQKKNRYECISFWQNDKKKWTTLSIPLETNAIVYWRHKFLILEINGKRIKVIDETTAAVSTIPYPSQIYDIDYLISVGDESLFAVKQNFARNIPLASLKNCSFEVYQFENHEKNPEWTKVSGIGDLVLFLDIYNGFSLKATTDFDGFRGNSIYFVTSVWDNCKRAPRLGRYDMSENRVETVPLPPWIGVQSSSVSWFVPTL